MSYNSTVIPGLNDPSQMQQAYQPINGVTRPFGVTTPGQETVIPGVSNANGMIEGTSNGQIFGFLFSVSRTMGGEYWPLLLGANTIGRGADNSINLGEMTVSEKHASIHVISRANKLIVYIKDDQSKTGTLLNGELLRGEADIKNGDIITIGEQYELYVVLINPYDLDLKVKTGFKAAETPAFAGQFPGVPGVVNRPIVQNATVVDGQSGSIPVGGHTVIMGGNLPGGRK